MSLILHLGVIDMPYSNAKTTTGDVAEILEGKYGVMACFYRTNETVIDKEMEKALEGSLETLMMGGSPSARPYDSAMNKIEELFNAFLDTGVMDKAGDVAGVPTQAALKGRSKRFKRNKGPPRPSFIDSGLYESSFKAWIET
jgi:hypothetical protein